MDYKEKIEEKRKKVVDTLISFIEQDPTQWEAGWYRAPSVSPMNGKTQKNYKGLNAFYLYVIAAMKGYRDPRWLTFNQVKELGGNVRNGEKSSEVFFDKRLDYRSRGLLCTIFSLPNGWEFSIPGLVALVTESDENGNRLDDCRGEKKDAVRAVIQYIERLGYLERIPYKDSKGQFFGYDYKINIPPAPIDKTPTYSEE